MRVMNSTLKRRKSISSHAASISAWCAVFDWPSMVAALSVSRHGPESSSAARRKTAARSSHGQRDQSFHASAAASTAACTCSPPPWWTSARTCSLSWGITAGRVSPVATSLPPITSGTSTRSLRICSSRSRSRARSGLRGEKSCTGSLKAAGGRKIACVLMRRTLETWTSRTFCGSAAPRARGTSSIAKAPLEEYEGLMAAGPRLQLAAEQVRRGDDDPDHEAEGRSPQRRVPQRPVGGSLGEADREDGDAAGDPEAAEPARHLPSTQCRERRRNDDRSGAARTRRREAHVVRGQPGCLEGDERRAAEDDDTREEALRIEPNEQGAQAAEEPEVRERGDGEDGRRSAIVVTGHRECEDTERDVDVAERGNAGAGQHAATVQHRS